MRTGHRIRTVAGVTAPLLPILLGLYCLSLIALPDGEILPLAPDDSLYYVGISQNLILGHGFTFDTINPTTGFQPGWLILLTSIYGAFSLILGSGVLSSPGFLLRTAFILTVAIRLVTGFLIWTRLKKMGGSTLLSSAFASIYLALSLNWDFMMETDLLLLLLLLFIPGLSARQDLRKTIGVLILPALCVFTRIDFISVLLGWSILCFFSSPYYESTRKQYLHRCLFYALSAIIGLILVMALCWFISGHILPVSVWLKASGSIHKTNPAAILSAIRILATPLISVPVIISLLMSASVFIIKPVGWKKFRSHFFLLVSMILLLIAQFAWSSLTGIYYAIPVIGFAVFLSGYSAVLFVRYSETKISGLLRTTASCLLLICCIPLISVSRSRLNNVRPAAIMELALLLREELPIGSTLFTTDFSGTLSLYSQLKIVNGDGLVNSYDYLFNYLMEGRVGNFLADECIDYYLSWRTKSTDLEAALPGSSITETFRPWFLDVPTSTVELYSENLAVLFKSESTRQEVLVFSLADNY